MRFVVKGSLPTGVDAASAASELQRIYERDGHKLRAQAIVDEERPEDAPLHHAFTWDDDVAAEAYRREQARQLVRTIYLQPEPERQESVHGPIRAFVSLPDPEGPSIASRAYHPTLSLQPDEREQVKSRMVRELIQFRQRYLDFVAYDEAMMRALSMLLSAAGAPVPVADDEPEPEAAPRRARRRAPVAAAAAGRSRRRSN